MLCSRTTQPREETSGKGRGSARCPQPRHWPCPASCILQPQVPLVIHPFGWCGQRCQQNLWDQGYSRWTGCPSQAALGVCPCHEVPHTGEPTEGQGETITGAGKEVQGPASPSSPCSQGSNRTKCSNSLGLQNLRPGLYVLLGEEDRNLTHISAVFLHFYNLFSILIVPWFLREVPHWLSWVAQKITVFSLSRLRTPLRASWGVPLEQHQVMWQRLAVGSEQTPDAGWER